MKGLRTGGAVGAGDIYVKRPADEALLGALSTGRLCHVLASSRTGKTSLVLRALRELESRGFRTAYVDVTGAVLAAERDASSQARFYREIALRVRHELRVDTGTPCEDAVGWQLLLRDLRELREDDGSPLRIALVLDETNTLLLLDRDTREGFLATFKAFDAARARTSSSALSICLAGYASPQALMTKAALSPFNASVGIDLDDFTLDELLIELAPKLAEHGLSEPEELLRAIHEWTGGHPYMMAKLVDLAQARVSGPEEVAALVEDAFLGVEESREPVLDFAAKQIKDGEVALVLRRLELYGEVWRNEQESVQRADRQLVLDLQTAGLVRSSGRPGAFTVRNKVFASYFDLSWIERALGEIDRPLTRGVERWRARGKQDSDLLRARDIRMAMEGSPTAFSGGEIEFLAASLARLSRRSRQVTLVLTALSTFVLTGVVAGFMELRSANAIRRLALEERSEAEAMRAQSAAQAAKLADDIRRSCPAVENCQTIDPVEKQRLKDLAVAIEGTNRYDYLAMLTHVANWAGRAATTEQEKTNARRLIEARGVFSECLVARQRYKDEGERCASERTQCSNGLVTRTTERDQCAANLDTCMKERAACNTGRDACTAERAGFEARLKTCLVDGATCQGILSTRTTERDACSANLATSLNEKNTSAASFNTCTRDLSACVTKHAIACAAQPTPPGCP